MPESHSLPKMKLLTHLGIQVALLALLALVSGYQVPDFSDSNWLTVMFLTPSGILSNHLDTDSVIRSFYDDISGGQVSLSLSQTAFMIVIYLGLVANLVMLMRQRKGLRP